MLANLWTGYFCVWFSQKDKKEKSVSMQPFPKWFRTSHLGGEQLYRQYSSVIEEWGYFLDYYSNVSGPFPGQISRCLWDTLETPNFSHVPSKYKRWAFEGNGKGPALSRFQLYEKFIIPSREITVVCWNNP